MNVSQINATLTGLVKGHARTHTAAFTRRALTAEPTDACAVGHLVNAIVPYRQRSFVPVIIHIPIQITEYFLPKPETIKTFTLICSSVNSGYEEENHKRASTCAETAGVKLQLCGSAVLFVYIKGRGVYCVTPGETIGLSEVCQLRK